MNRCMAREGERKRKVGKDLDEEGESGPINCFRHLSEEELIEKITRDVNFGSMYRLPDGGEKLRANIKKMEAELARRKLEKVGLFISCDLFAFAAVLVCENRNYFWSYDIADI